MVRYGADSWHFQGLLKQLRKSIFAMYIVKETRESESHYLEWLLQNLENYDRSITDKLLIKMTARKGNLNLLKVLFSEMDITYNADAHIVSEAAKAGHLEILKWVRQEEGIARFDRRFADWILKTGLDKQHADIVEWIHEIREEKQSTLDEKDLSEAVLETLTSNVDNVLPQPRNDNVDAEDEMESF